MEILRAETNEFPHLKVCFLYPLDFSFVHNFNRIPMVRPILIILHLPPLHQQLMMMMKIDFQMLVLLMRNAQPNLL